MINAEVINIIAMGVFKIFGFAMIFMIPVSFFRRHIT